MFKALETWLSLKFLCWKPAQTRRWMDELDVVLNYVSGLSGLTEIK